MRGFTRPDSILRYYMDAITNTSEAPEKFHHVVALGTLGACLGRRAVLPWGPHRLYTITETVLVGPPGIGKTEAMKIGRRLLKRVNPNVFILGDEATPEGLVLAFSKMPSPDGGVIDRSESPEPNASEVAVFAGEMATLVNKKGSTEGMIPVLTKLMEQDDEYTRTLVKDLQQGRMQALHDPTFSFIGGTNATWMRTQMPPALFEGGFWRRCLVARATTKGLTIEIPSDLDDDIIENLASKWHNKLEPFFQFQRRFDFNPVAGWWRSWRRQHDKNSPKDERMAGHHNSFPERLLRMACCFAAACGRWDLRKEDFDDALEFLEVSEKDANSILLEAGGSGFGDHCQTLERLLVEHSVIDERKLRMIFKVPPREFDDLITWGSKAEILLVEGGKVYYTKGAAYKTRGR